MKFVDRTKLEILMCKNGLRIKDIAEELCTSYQNCYKKIRYSKDFSEDEIYRLFQLFGNDLFFLDNAGRKLRANTNGNKRKTRSPE